MSCKNKTYLALVVSAIIVIALLVFLIGPLVSKIKLISSILKEKKSAITSLEERSGDYLKFIQNKYNELEQKISKINNSFNDPEKAVDFIVAVEKIAVLTNNYQQIRETSSTEKNVLSFQISLWGSFPNLIEFLAQLENMNYFVDSASLQITRIDERELTSLIEKKVRVSDGDVKSVINIKTYAKD